MSFSRALIPIVSEQYGLAHDYGLDSQLDPIECADEGRGGKEISSQFVVAGGDAPPILDTTEEVFDLVPLPIETLRTIGLFDRVAAVRDDRQSPFVLDLLTRCLTVVGLVGGDDERRSRRIQDFFDDLAVMDLSTSDGEVQWSAFAIDDRMDFRGPPTTADANRLIFLPCPFRKSYPDVMVVQAGQD